MLCDPGDDPPENHHLGDHSLCLSGCGCHSRHLRGTVPGTAFAVGVGVACDLLLPASSPCFYTLVFPLVGLCAALLSESVCRAGFLCSLLSTAAAFCITGLAHALVLWAGSKAAWGAAASVAGRELCLTLPFALPMTVLFRAVYRRAHRND